MKIPKEARKLSRSLFRASLGADGRLEERRVRTVLAVLGERPPRKAPSVLAAYARLVRLELARRHARLESASALSPRTLETVLGSLKARFGADITHEAAVSPALIGGLRVSLGSDVWDGSISGRLEQLRGNI